jgi:hypothetical protein
MGADAVSSGVFAIVDRAAAVPALAVLHQSHPRFGATLLGCQEGAHCCEAAAETEPVAG